MSNCPKSKKQNSQERSGKMEGKKKWGFVGLLAVALWGIGALTLTDTVFAVDPPKKMKDPIVVQINVVSRQKISIPLFREKLVSTKGINASTLVWNFYPGAPAGMMIVSKAKLLTPQDHVQFTPNSNGTYTFDIWAYDAGTLKKSTYRETYVINVGQKYIAPSQNTAALYEVTQVAHTFSGNPDPGNEPNSVIGGGNYWIPSIIADSHIGAEYNNIRSYVPNLAAPTLGHVHLAYFNPPVAADGSEGMGDVLYSLSLDTAQSWEKYPVPGTDPALYNPADPATFVHKFDLTDPLTYVNYVVATADGIYGDGLITWEVVSGVDKQVGQFASLALDTTPAALSVNLGGVPHISHYDLLNQDLLHTWQSGWRRVYDVSGTPVDIPLFTTEQVDTTGNTGRHTSIAVDSQGTLHISYYDRTSTALKYARKPVAGSWNVRTLDGSGAENIGLGTSIATYTEGAVIKVGIAYFDATADVWDLRFIESVNAGSSFGSSILVDGTDDVGRDPALAYDDSGNLGIAYRNATNLSLKFKERDRFGVWSNPITVDSGVNTGPAGGTADVGTYVSLSFDHQGFGAESSPMITYHDATTTGVRFAERMRTDETAGTTNLSPLQNLALDDPINGARWKGVELKNVNQSIDPMFPVPFGRFTSAFVDGGNNVLTAFQNPPSDSVEMQKSFSGGMPPPPEDPGDIEEPNNHKPEVAKILDKVDMSINYAAGSSVTLIVYDYARDVDLENVGGVITGRDPLTLTAQIKYDSRLGNQPRGWVAIGPYMGSDAVNIDGQKPASATTCVPSEFNLCEGTEEPLPEIPGPFCLPPTAKSTPYFCPGPLLDVSDGTKMRGKLVWAITANSHTPSAFYDVVKHEIRFIATSPKDVGSTVMRKDKEQIKIRTWKYCPDGGTSCTPPTSGSGGSTTIDRPPRWFGGS